MNISIKKPILISGVGLSFLIFIGQRLSMSFPHLGEYGFWGLILVSGFFWLFNPRANKDDSVTVFEPITPEIFDQALEQVKRLITIFAQESASSDTIFTQRLQTIVKGDRTIAHVAMVSNHKLNSQYLKNILEQKIPKNTCQFTNFTASSLDYHTFETLLVDYDLVLLMVQGDLTESEKDIIQKLISNQQKTILVFNQSDYNLPEEQEIIKAQLKNRIKGIINLEELIIISTKNEVIKVKKYQDKENYQEWQENINPQCENLLNYLSQTLTENLSDLFLATNYRQLLKLKKDIHQQINIIRKQKALPIVEKYQWIAASATFANPVASLDLLAVGAINTQMIIDLGNIYQQKITVNQAKQISLELAKLIMKLGIVELSSRAIASILKTNTITYIAGGVMQGISAAYLTRICSLSLIEYLEKQDISTAKNHSTLNIDFIKKSIEKIFKDNQKSEFLNNFIVQTTQKLGWQKV
ncbi:YcjF family protein [Cyanobacterium stanieri LEGE 03274]|uniref:YcjF family protein n=1 Tax=Cyanobacterium stanieri LEGE 03274 TaxID=1828756 RepID=A0ABR9V8Y4_9CHRO|nr:YcjF family protein [Cyanobacterium stanieri]MBE9223309.1 YcjF family protein [Cyanobacterium stanieri LEGE 03274]